MKRNIFLKKQIPLFFIIAGFVLFPTCTLPTPNPAISIPESPETLSPTPAPTETAAVPTPQVIQSTASDLIPIQTFDDSSSLFCQSGVDLTKTGGLTFACSDGKFTFRTAPGTKDNDKYLQIAEPIQPSISFTIEADLLSRPMLGKPDQNNYGLILGIDSTHTYSLRFKGQYYRFEKNLLLNSSIGNDGEIHITKSWNWNYSPFLKSAGNTNHIQLICGGGYCALNVNQSLVARFNLDQEINVSSIALFAEVGYYEPFGSVEMDNLHVVLPQDKTDIQTPFAFSDQLISENGIFSKTGLSGAYNKYQADGFLFSSVVPFGYYGVKTDPALGDVSISASVVLKADNINSSMYAGLVCRSSVEGMYFAVIRENGYFSIFRDTPTRPFSRLAEARSKEILTGGAANQLRLDCVGSTITFYINSKKVASVEDNRFNLVFGRSGFFTKTGKNPGEAAITFSNLEIKEVR
jgi:hypothetical protein